MSLSTRLGRLLFIVPYVAHRDGVPLSELADKLGVTARQIEADLELLAMVGQPPLTPDHLVDLYVEDDIVYVELDQSLSRPLRLTHEEARALVLAAKLVSNLGGLGEQLDDVLRRIVDVLNPVDRDIVLSLSQRIGMWQEGGEPVDVASDLRACLESHCEIELDYYSASSDREKMYRLQPLALISHSGIEYLVALDTHADNQEKLFRLDRVGSVRPTDVTFVPPAALDLERFRTQRLYFGRDGFTAHALFDSHIAREVTERFSPDDVSIDAAGNARVRLATSSLAWLTRWILPFGSKAEILSPPEVRTHLAEFCRNAAKAYAPTPEQVGVSAVS